MSAITIQDVQHLAQLSSLSLSDKEAENLQTDLTNILNYIDQLSELDTEGVEPTYQVTGLENVWRDDVIDDSAIGQKELLELVPETIATSIKVPKVL